MIGRISDMNKARRRQLHNCGVAHLKLELGNQDRDFDASGTAPRPVTIARKGEPPETAPPIHSTYIHFSRKPGVDEKSPQAAKHRGPAAAGRKRHRGPRPVRTGRAAGRDQWIGAAGVHDRTGAVDGEGLPRGRQDLDARRVRGSSPGPAVRPGVPLTGPAAHRWACSSPAVGPQPVCSRRRAASEGRRETPAQPGRPSWPLPDVSQLSAVH